MNGYGPAFASTNPAVAQLFANIFATQRAADASAQAAAAQETARAQIDAQERLAQAQLAAAGQDKEYNRLFRDKQLKSQEQAEAERNRLTGRYYDILEKGGARSAVVDEQQKARIKLSNAEAQAAARRFQDIYDTQLEAAVTAAKNKEKDALWGWRGLRPNDEKAIDDKWDLATNPDRMKLETDTWLNVLKQMQTDRSGSGQLVIPDQKSRRFLPALLDENGNLLGTGGTTSSSSSNPAALGAGVAPTVSKADAGGDGGAFKLDISPLAGLFKAPWVPATTGTYTSAATGAIPSPSAMTVRRPLGDRTVLLAPEDDATLARQLGAVPAEQRPAAYANMVEQLLKSGRARLVPVGGFVPPGSTNYVEPNYNRYQ